jgi:hypothetical protein
MWALLPGTILRVPCRRRFLPPPRAVYVTVLVCVCRAELAAYLLMRVLKRKKDARFDEMRERFWVRHEVAACHRASVCRRRAHPRRPQAFLGFWVFQMIWVWGTSVSFVFANAEPVDSPLEWRDILGIVLWGEFVCVCVCVCARARWMPPPTSHALAGANAIHCLQRSGSGHRRFRTTRRPSSATMPRTRTCSATSGSGPTPGTRITSARWPCGGACSCRVFPPTTRRWRATGTWGSCRLCSRWPFCCS